MIVPMNRAILALVVLALAGFLGGAWLLFGQSPDESSLAIVAPEQGPQNSTGALSPQAPRVKLARPDAAENEASARREMTRTDGQPQRSQSFAATANTVRPVLWQWEWDEPLAPDLPLTLTLHTSSDWSRDGESIRLQATL